MIDFDNPTQALNLLACCLGLNLLYKKGSYRYPGRILAITSNAELQLLILTFYLVFVGVLWYATLDRHWTLLASLFSDLCQILIPAGSAWWLTWLWAGYFGILLSVSLIATLRAALRRIFQEAPIVSLKKQKSVRSSLWAWIAERRRPRKEQARLRQDTTVDLEKSGVDVKTDVVVVVGGGGETEVEEPTAAILAENSTIRRSHALLGLNAVWLYLVVVGVYLDNQLVWNAHMSDDWGLFCNMLAVAFVYTFPTGWASSFWTVYEAALDNQEARALLQAGGEARGAAPLSEETPLIVITEEGGLSA